MDCRTRSSTSLAPASYLRAFFLVHFGVYLWITSSDCARSTLNDGLGVDTREGDSQHFGSPVFNRAAYVIHELEQVAKRHEHDAHGKQVEELLEIR